MAALVEWSDELSVGIEEIDSQHKVLVNILNELHSAILDRKGSEVSMPILNRLIEYTRVHFTVEESLMRMLAYPDYETHKQGHDKLIDEIHDLQGKLATGQANVTFELLHFLKSWLTHHIMESDRLYGPYFLERGVVRSQPKKRFWSFWK